MKGFVVVTLLVAALFALAGCGDGGVDTRECLKGHVIDSVQVMPVIGMNGQMSTSIVPVSEFVCDEYAPEPSPS